MVLWLPVYWKQINIWKEDCEWKRKVIGHYFASCPKPLSQDETVCEASDMKIFFSVVMLIKLIMWKVLNLALELGNGPLQWINSAQGTRTVDILCLHD